MKKVIRIVMCLALLGGVSSMVPAAVFAAPSQGFSDAAATSDNQMRPAGQRTYSVSKATCPTQSSAILKAQNANPGWKVVSIKDRGATWSMILKN